tara:strand:+ start:13550 stop:14578 length:1029 start_codon:yes stop_codon:yes gene_type:complete
VQSDATTIIALRGWHPAIARAEAKAMFADSDIARTDSRRLLTATGESDWENAKLMSGCECVLVNGGISKWTSLEYLLQQIKSEKVEDMAVECWRHEGKIPVATKDIERQVGGLFHDKGSTFNLENPKRRFGIVLDNSAGYVAWGWMIGQGPGKHGWSAMRANKRPFFRPVSLEPRLARAAVNIAAGVSEGYVVDPMCGTGGILIESALTGRPTLGIDFDPVMVEGCQQNIDWAEVNAEVKRGDATRFELPKNLAAVVVDPPYGRNSPSDERLIEDMLTNILAQDVDSKLVAILPVESGGENLDEEISTNIKLPGYRIDAAFGIPVHKSLGRVMIIASASTQD